MKFSRVSYCAVSSSFVCRRDVRAVLLQEECQTCSWRALSKHKVPGILLRNAFQCLRAARKKKSLSSTRKSRTRSASVLNVGMFAAGRIILWPLFIDCSSAFMSCFNITSAHEVTNLTLDPLCAYSLKYPRGNWSSEPLHASQDGSFPWSVHPLQLKVTGLHSTDSNTPK